MVRFWSPPGCRCERQLLFAATPCELRARAWVRLLAGAAWGCSCSISSQDLACLSQGNNTSVASHLLLRWFQQQKDVLFVLPVWLREVILLPCRWVCLFIPAIRWCLSIRSSVGARL
jgi:hypothetical protein